MRFSDILRVKETYIFMRNDDYLLSWSSAARMLSGKGRDVDRRGSVEEMGGWKVALIKNPVLGVFKGLSFGEYNVREGIARCERDVEHKPPVVSCECGFHAHRFRSEAERYLGRRRGLVLVKVELYGDIVVHKEGVRGEEQDVIAVYLRKRCSRWFCRGVSAGIKKRRDRWEERCARHLGDGLRINEWRSISGYEIVVS